MQSIPPVPEARNIEDYLESSEIIDWQVPEIALFAQTMAADSDSEVNKAKQLYEWVRDSIAHSADAGHITVTCRASEVLRHRTGICYAKAHVLAAMMRAVGIPAGLCYQLLRYDESSERLVLHGFNAVYLKSIGQWIRVDPRGNKPGVNAHFSVEREQLAFAADPALGERTCETVFARPLPNVVACLTRFGTVTELMAHLPDSFNSVVPAA
jgi:transglutaminase-like putative cysteine protease